MMLDKFCQFAIIVLSEYFRMVGAYSFWRVG